MATASEITQQIAAVLAGVAGIGNVHTYDRFFTSEAEFRTHHVTTLGDGAQEIRSATITRAAVLPGETAKLRTGGAICLRRDWKYEIKIIRGQHDASASQIALDDIVDAVCDAFEAEAAHDAFYALGYVYGPVAAEPIGLAGYGNPPFVAVNQAIITLILEEPS